MRKHYGFVLCVGCYYYSMPSTYDLTKVPYSKCKVICLMFIIVVIEVITREVKYMKSIPRLDLRDEDIYNDMKRGVSVLTSQLTS